MKLSNVITRHRFRGHGFRSVTLALLLVASFSGGPAVATGVTPSDPFSGVSLGSGWEYSSWFGYYNNNNYPTEQLQLSLG